MARTIEEIREFSLKTGNDKFGYPPTLNVPVENIVSDELHLMLRITGTVPYFIIMQYIKLHILYT
jgi:hypothetical protein